MAAVWMFVGSVGSFFGVIHAFALEGNSVKPLLVRVVLANAA